MIAVEVGSLAVGAAIVAVVTIVAGLVLGWTQRSVRLVCKSFVRAFRADHRAISTGWFGRDQGAQAQFLVSIKCAPSKSLRTPVRLDPDEVAGWVSAAFGEIFPPMPCYSDPTEVVRFESGPLATTETRAFAIAWSSGLLVFWSSGG